MQFHLAPTIFSPLHSYFLAWILVCLTSFVRRGQSKCYPIRIDDIATAAAAVFLFQQLKRIYYNFLRRRLFLLRVFFFFEDSVCKTPGARSIRVVPTSVGSLSGKKEIWGIDPQIVHFFSFFFFFWGSVTTTCLTAGQNWFLLTDWAWTTSYAGNLVNNSPLFFGFFFFLVLCFYFFPSAVSRLKSRF